MRITKATLMKAETLTAKNFLQFFHEKTSDKACSQQDGKGGRLGVLLLNFTLQFLLLLTTAKTFLLLLFFSSNNLAGIDAYVYRSVRYLILIYSNHFGDFNVENVNLIIEG